MQLHEIIPQEQPIMDDMRGIGNGMYLWTFHMPDGTWKAEVTDDQPGTEPIHIETGKRKSEIVGACARWLNEQLNGQQAQTSEVQP